MAMFPPAIPNLFIHWLTEPGEIVYDPFSGRGTTVLEACLADRVGLGSDANPLAALLTSIKCDPPTRAVLTRRLNHLSSITPPRQRGSVPDDIRMLFSEGVLKQLLWLRRELDLSKRADRFILAVLAGMLHGNANGDGEPRGLSIPMPNTFAMAPGYVRRYIKEHRLEAPEVNVLAMLSQRIATFPLPSEGFRRGASWIHDAGTPVEFPCSGKAKLVFTSPPYLQVIKYGKFNWIRHWLIGSDPRAVDEGLFASGSLSKYLSFMKSVIGSVRPVLRDDGYLCMVVGDVQRGDEELNLAKEIASTCFDETDLTVLGSVRDSLPVQHKVSRIWGSSKGRATRTDRIIIAAGPKAKRLVSPKRVIWSSV